MSVETADGAVRESLVFTLRLGDAHQTFDDAVADFPMDAINVRPPNVGYTFWHLIEHVVDAADRGEEQRPAFYHEREEPGGDVALGAVG